jgi:hypothetical protein
MIMHHERRRFGRRTVFKPAWLSNDLFVRLHGIVVDISEGGARLRIDTPENVDGQYLAIPEDNALYQCRIVHRQKDSLGLEFTSLTFSPP